MHNDARGHFRKMNHLLMIASILLTSVSSVSAIGILSSQGTCSSDDKTTSWVLLALNSVGLLSATLVSIHRFLSVSELQEQHDLYSDLYDILAKDIDLQMALTRSHVAPVFVSLSEFAKHCKARLDMLIDKGPSIPGFIERRAVLQADRLRNEQLKDLQAFQLQHDLPSLSQQPRPHSKLQSCGKPSMLPPACTRPMSAPLRSHQPPGSIVARPASAPVARRPALIVPPFRPSGRDNTAAYSTRAEEGV